MRTEQFLLVDHRTLVFDWVVPLADDRKLTGVAKFGVCADEDELCFPRTATFLLHRCDAGPPGSRP